jgi:hypothetical protein
MIRLVYTHVSRWSIFASMCCALLGLAAGCSKGSGPAPHGIAASVNIDPESARIAHQFGERVHGNIDPPIRFPADWRSAPVSANGIHASVDTDPEVVRIRQEFGVRVHVNFDPASYFPANWRSAPRSANCVQIEPGAATQLKKLIPCFLAMYPRALIAGSLRDIYLLKSMSFYGLKYGGTNRGDSIYITCRGDGHGERDLFLLAGMHHEFSSILYRNYGFPAQEWSRINESGWRYIGSGKDLLGRLDLFEVTEDLLSKGFTSVYSQASLLQDVNMYVFSVIHDEALLVSAGARHKRVKQKLDLLTRFYDRIDRQIHPSDRFEFLDRLKSILDRARHGATRPILIAKGR